MMELSIYDSTTFYDEMVTPDHQVRPSCRMFFERTKELSMGDLISKQKWAGDFFRKTGITFNYYIENREEEAAFPFDIIPRIISRKEWNLLEEGLIQRTRALNSFLADVYGPRHAIRDGVIDREVVESSPGYLPALAGFVPPRGIWTHITGIDLVRGGNGSYFALEDNVRTPSGVSYMLANRAIMKRTFPRIFENHQIAPIFDYPLKLLEALSSLSHREKPVIVILTPGIYNSAYFEHAYLAQQMGVQLVEPGDLTVSGDKLYMRTTRGMVRVDVIYRRVDDTFLDPLVFRPDSMLGVKGLMELYFRGEVAIANAPGTGVADDKVVYSYVPDLIRYYLSEEPILSNVETYQCRKSRERQYVLEHLDQLVLKPANGSGGYGVVIGSSLPRNELERCREEIIRRPRNYIAQPVIKLSRVPSITEKGICGRHVDLRPFVLYGKKLEVIPGGLTRVALAEGSLIVNSSQGGGSKDTWVVEEDE